MDFSDMVKKQREKGIVKSDLEDETQQKIQQVCDALSEITTKISLEVQEPTLSIHFYECNMDDFLRSVGEGYTALCNALAILQSQYGCKW